MHVHELAAGVAHTQAETRDRHGGGDGANRQRTCDDLTPAAEKHDAGQHPGDARCEQKLLRHFLVLMNDALGHDRFHAVFVGLAGSHRHERGGGKQALERDDDNPRAGTGASCPERPREAGREDRHQHRERQRKMHNGGV
jgi:hypothetical protein